MSMRTLVLLIVAIVVWGLAIYVLFFSPWGIGTPKIVISSKKSEQVVTVSKKSFSLTSSVLDEYSSIVEKGIRRDVDMFRPRKLGLSPEELNTLIMESKESLKKVEFVGYIIKGNEGKIFLSMNGRMVDVERNSLILNRYLVIHVSSLGMVVLDLEEGGLETIK